MELKDKLELLKFKIKAHCEEIEKYNTESTCFDVYLYTIIDYFTRNNN
jgi:hypothetical protein